MTDDDEFDPEEPPPYLDVADLVRVSELSDTVVREHCKKLGIAEKIGNRLLISRYDLRDRWPSMYRTLLAKAAEGMSLRPERPTPQPPQRGALLAFMALHWLSLAFVALRSANRGPTILLKKEPSLGSPPLSFRMAGAGAPPIPRQGGSCD